MFYLDNSFEDKNNELWNEYKYYIMFADLSEIAINEKI